MTTMSVTSILRSANRSCDFCQFNGSPEGWMEMINLKANDSGFFRLIDSILENGWAPESGIGYSNGFISEGHHRLVAAILLGLDEIPVSDWGGSWYNENGDIISAHQEFYEPRLTFDYF